MRNDDVPGLIRKLLPPVRRRAVAARGATLACALLAASPAATLAQGPQGAATFPVGIRELDYVDPHEDGRRQVREPLSIAGPRNLSHQLHRLGGPVHPLLPRQGGNLGDQLCAQLARACHKHGSVRRDEVHLLLAVVLGRHTARVSKRAPAVGRCDNAVCDPSPPTKAVPRKISVPSRRVIPIAQML